MAKDTGTAPAPRSAEKVRNVALVGHAGAGKTTLAEALLVATGALPRMGRRSRTAPPASTPRRWRSASSARSPWGGHRRAPGPPADAAGHPGFAGLRGGAAGGAARRGRRPLRRLRRQRRRRHHRAAVGGVRRRRDAAGRRHHPARPCRAPTWTTSSGSASGSSARASSRCTCSTAGPDGAVRGLVSLLEPHRTSTAAPDADRLRGELIEGIIGESEDETLMERYLSGDELAVADLVADLETAVARGHFHPVLCVVPAHRGRRPGAPRPPRGGVPVPEGARLPARRPPRRRRRRRRWTATPTGRWWPRSSRRPPTPTWAGSPWSGSSPGTLRPDIPIHVSGHGMTDRGHPDHDVDERIGAVSSPLGARSARSRRARRATSARSRGSAAPRPATRSPPRRTRGSSRRGTCPRRSCRSRSRRPPAPTRTASRPPWPGWWPRTRPCGWSAGPTPASCCCGAWGRRTRRSSWSGCAAGTESR